MSDVAPEKRGGKEVVYRVVLAPDKALGDWTVADLRKFVDDCDAQGITGGTKLQRSSSPPYGFQDFYVQGPLVAERKVTLA